MAGERLNSEKKIEHNKIKLKIGTIDKKMPKVIYVEGRTFVTPDGEKENTQRDITDIKHNFKKLINECLYNNEYFEPKYILDFQVAAGSIHVGKKSFMSFQLILSQKGEILQKMTEIKEQCESMFVKLADGLAEETEDRGYILSKMKKKTEDKNAILLH